jgi:hypothetical protein
LDHLDEWWLAGTDVTRHWMATGVTWSHEQTDVTNHYIALGVLGGLPLLLSFLGVMALAFHHVSQRLRNADAGPASSPFLAWALGSALFTIAVRSTGRTRRHVRQRAASAAVDVARPPASVRTRRRRRVPLQHGDALRSTKR